MRNTLIGLTLALFLAAPAAAQQPPLPTLTQPVNDFAAVIDEQSARDLDQKIRALKAATGDALVIVTVPTIAPFATVEEYAVKLFEKAGIGDRRLDNGLLILVAVKEHGIRVEVGYGLEGVVTDGFAGDTIRSLMVPRFRNNRYGEGLLAGTSQLIDRISQGRANPEQFNKKTEPTGLSFWLGLMLFLVICLAVVGFIVFVIYRIAKATGGIRNTPSGGRLGGSTSDDSGSSSRSSSSSSDNSSSFDGFGGGRSGGGGASGSW